MFENARHKPNYCAPVLRTVGKAAPMMEVNRVVDTEIDFICVVLRDMLRPHWVGHASEAYFHGLLLCALTVSQLAREDDCRHRALEDFDWTLLLDMRLDMRLLGSEGTSISSRWC